MNEISDSFDTNARHGTGCLSSERSREIGHVTQYIRLQIPHCVFLLSVSNCLNKIYFGCRIIGLQDDPILVWIARDSVTRGQSIVRLSCTRGLVARNSTTTDSKGGLVGFSVSTKKHVNVLTSMCLDCLKSYCIQCHLDIVSDFTNFQATQICP